MIDIITGSSNKGGLYIDSGNNLAVKGEGPIFCTNSPYRPLLASEFQGILSDRKFHLTERTKVSEEGVLSREYFDGDGSVEFKREDLTGTDALNTLTLEALKVQTTMYSSSEITFDLINYTVSLDLIDWDEYTNTVSLVKIANFFQKPGIEAKVDLSIKYNIDGVISAQDISFKGFEYNDDSELQREDFITTLEDVQLEYINGEVRLVPVNDNISECVISNCLVSYGNIKG